MNPSPILNPAESAENQRCRDALFELVSSRIAIAFVGAGSSQRCGYPGWGALAQQLGDLVGLSPPSTIDLRKNPLRALNFVEQVKACVNTRDRSLAQYHAALQQMFAPKKLKAHDNFHEQLVGLPFRAIVTSNYDEVLESALGAVRVGLRAVSCDIDDDARATSSQFLRSLDRLEDPPVILHVHGTHTKPTKIILGEQDYVRAYGWMHERRKKDEADGIGDVGEWTFQSRLMWALFATRSIVFIGFSLTDPYFNYLLEVVTKDLWEWNQQNHFAVMSLSNEDAEEAKSFAKHLLHKHGIRVVFYENADGLHTGLDQLIRDASVFCNTGDRSGWLEAANRRLEGGAVR